MRNLQNLHIPAAQPLPPTLPKSIFKITKKSDLEKKPQKFRKIASQGLQTDPDGRPNPLISIKSAYQNAGKKKGARSDASEVVQDPLFPLK